MEDRIKELENENYVLKEQLSKIEEASKKKTKHRKGVLKFIGGFIAGKKLKKSIYNLLEEYNSQRNVTRNTLSDFLANLIKRITRIGVVTILFAVLPSVLLMRQNMLLKQQNRKIQDQTHLAEASRRSAQMFIMGDVLSDVNTELKNGKSISNTLKGRLISLSKAMKPYRYIHKDELIEKPISPERGQLLITLCKSDMNPYSFSDIIQECDFTQAELIKGNLSNTKLIDVNLEAANLSHSDMENVNLTISVLKNAILENVDFTDAILKRTNFANANLTNANLMFANIEGANFTSANLHNVKVHRIDWLDYIKNKLKLKGSEALYKGYKIDSVYFRDLDVKVPTILKK